jgi:phage terminase large subunit GpA-like protein
VRYWFKPSGKRNEALDRRVYALAALHARPVPWEVLLRGTERAAAAAAVTAGGRRTARRVSLIAAAVACEPLRAEANTF